MAEADERLFDRLLARIAELQSASLALQREIEAELDRADDAAPESD